MENNICNSMILTSRRRHFYLVGQSKHKVGACGVNNQASAVLAVARIALRTTILNPTFVYGLRSDHAFTFSGISGDDTKKYSALVANLDAETLSYVSDIVLSPPGRRCPRPSQRLITQFSDSETQTIKKLLTFS
ncbi:hypothetical protein TNCV_5024431 [Trichonephila clavipes]|nr:hypothetical protein TNCV_5024431 [Trichonephila clavipes]